MEAFTFLKYWRGGANARPAVTDIVNAPLETEGEDGPFFDLEFGVPDENETEQPHPDSSGTDSDSEEEFNVPVSPLDELFFKGESAPIETTTQPGPDLEPSPKSQFSRLKSASNFRVLMLKLKKNKENANEKKEKTMKDETQGKFFTIKFKFEEIPMKSVFKRHNSSKSSKKTECGEEKKLSKDVMQKYLKMVRILKRNGGETTVVEGDEVAMVPARRRDDSLVQQQDGIQSAILHCKRSFNASRESEFSILSPSVSDPLHDQKSVTVLTKKCSGEMTENGL